MSTIAVTCPCGVRRDVVLFRGCRFGNSLAEDGGSRWVLATTAVPSKVGELGGGTLVNIPDYHVVGMYPLTQEEVGARFPFLSRMSHGSRPHGARTVAALESLVCACVCVMCVMCDVCVCVCVCVPLSGNGESYPSMRNCDTCFHASSPPPPPRPCPHPRPLS